MKQLALLVLSVFSFGLFVLAFGFIFGMIIVNKAQNAAGNAQVAGQSQLEIQTSQSEYLLPASSRSSEEAGM